jgi:hypothetical protein
MNINIGLFKGVYDAFDLDDPRVGVPLDAIPTFITMHLDRALFKPVDHMNGGYGTCNIVVCSSPVSFTQLGRMSIIYFSRQVVRVVPIRNQR